MFYSHEILTNQAHGVATVWVYSQQCHYVLTDAERVQAHMRAFYSALGGRDNALDPQAGKSKREELILQDDPEFDLNTDLPAFHFDEDGNLVVPRGSQSSRKTSSQLSPLQGDGSFSGSNRSFLAAFDLSHSPLGGENSLIGEAFGAGTMTPGKGDDDLVPFGEDERELQAIDDWGIEIDADGNIIPVLEEPQLPRLPHPEEEETAQLQEDEFMPIDDQGDVIMGGTGDIFHSDPPIPLRQEQQQQNQQGNQGSEREQDEREAAAQEEASSRQAQVRARRQRRRPILAPDDQTKISRQELKSWSANYLANAEQASQTRRGVTATEARQNAFNLVFGGGIARVGVPTGIPGFPHPLASHFAGEGLQARLLGIIVTHPDGEDPEGPRGRRRSALEALELEEDEAPRRVRRRLSEEPSQDNQHSQPQLPQPDDGLPPLLGDDELPPVEVGRRAEFVLPDIPSDTPWNRGSSQIPSSSVKGGGSKPPSRQVSASPLHGRGNRSLMPGDEIERYSDNAPFPGSDGFEPLHSGPAGSLLSSPLFPGGTAQSASQIMRHALDREGQNFLDYVAAIAKEHGSLDAPATIANTGSGSGSVSSPARRWIEFDRLFEPEDRTRAVAAQAFYHVLSLATKSVIKVAQDGQGGTEPFGVIRLGVDTGIEEDGDEQEQQQEEILGD
ncbi:uncharacterized protein THITE_119822 [Thermothielavioides terrestris NRRL 8126]|uniref:Rad21/Rec8-like protein C-terminal eukaryotic domain-containing protein n=1 Tax=Thermothielavioides terrestris (strain ATCC 38088 / NRRL 8126) TaxID=578455 RepID=G2R515_THETT|nr:uncharacterized protein THITE_119822 [Thermothielavioides terrestris NRRL 8126]AEO65292.1 hypothetical protein THITE_119822 [Thermothielavioides terrestris NRRL 8126]